VTGWFFQSPLVRQVPGGAASGSIHDLDGDGRGELLYLTPASGEANIRKMDAASHWSPARALRDGRASSIVDGHGYGWRRAPGSSEFASFGDAQDPGGLGYRRQLPDHTFGSAQWMLPMPGGRAVRCYGTTAGDFDGDGLMDRGRCISTAALRSSKALLRDSCIAAPRSSSTESRSVVRRGPRRGRRLGHRGSRSVWRGGHGGKLRSWFTGGPYLKRKLIGGPLLPERMRWWSRTGNGDGDLDLHGVLTKCDLALERRARPELRVRSTVSGAYDAERRAGGLRWGWPYRHLCALSCEYDGLLLPRHGQ
jgi:hypothetical protein